MQFLMVILDYSELCKADEFQVLTVSVFAFNGLDLLRQRRRS